MGPVGDLQWCAWLGPKVRQATGPGGLAGDAVCALASRRAPGPEARRVRRAAEHDPAGLVSYRGPPVRRSHDLIVYAPLTQDVIVCFRFRWRLAALRPEHLPQGPRDTVVTRRAPWDS